MRSLLHRLCTVLLLLGQGVAIVVRSSTSRGLHAQNTTATTACNYRSPGVNAACAKCQYTGGYLATGEPAKKMTCHWFESGSGDICATDNSVFGCPLMRQCPPCPLR
eukprot:gnl/TRDRNA2_/TRDRNA2_191121_c0_seq1.p1 gnl/TRDRNA2_/TRDRNA2_191121_c0~~gnl/TRDRNA2_/TRDRNA2_191121_c0_seq1.p1  ORF type:complete len:107 (+),score=3.52 gnl/TRDRNA2_/TRDRNA2_191121_c0_seq1:62-382(+)